MQILNCKQGSDEWKEARKLKLTASKATAIATGGKGLETLVFDLCSAHLSSNPEDTFEGNKHTERGNEWEAAARMAYEAEKGVQVQEVGFVIYNEYVGCSPDGLVGEDGGVEIKCLMDREFLRMLVNGSDEVDSGHIWQMQMNMKILNRKWWDYVCYNPNFETSIIIFRYMADPKAWEKLDKGFELGEKRIKGVLEAVKK
jgi:hypothetical protein